MNSFYTIQQIRILYLLMIFVFCLDTGTAQENLKINKKGQYENVFHVKFKEGYTLKLDQELLGSSLKKAKKGEYVRLNIKEFDNQNKKYKVRSMKRLFRPAGKFEEKHRRYGLHLWYEIRFDAKITVDQIIESYKNTPVVEIAEAIYEVKFADGYTENNLVSPIKETKNNTTIAGNLNNAPNDPRYNEQWHYHNTGQSPDAVAGNDIKLEEAWKIETGNSLVIVAIEDTGFDVNHPDLKGNLWVNTREIPGNNIDDDNNGYVDDIHGYNFADDTGAIPAGRHGTHVAGTVAAETNNGIGVAGIAGGSGNDDGVLLMSNTVFGHNKAGFAEAFVYAADNGAVISQNSWGYGGIGPAIREADKAGIDYFIATAGGANATMNGGIVIFATGNNGAEGTFYPSRYDPILSVSSLANSGKKASYSNYGTWVDISAPGGDQTTSGSTAGVLSTTPGNSYGYLQGTSMACPHASGVAALVVSRFAGKLSGKELKLLLENSTNSVDHLNPSYSGKLGTGIINALKALQHGDANVSPPTNITISDIGARTVVLQWESVDQASRYQIRYRESNGQWVENTTNETSFKLRNLNKSTTYQVQIRAESLTKVSDYSNIREFTTISLEVPNNVTITSITQSGVTISWEASDAADLYTLRFKKRDDTEWTLTTPITFLSETLTDLSHNTFYQVQVKASNETVSSIYSDPITFLTLDDGSGGCNGVPAWESDKIYATPGQKVVYQRVIYQNKWWTQNDIPGSSNPWEKIDECDPIGNQPPVVTITNPEDAQVIEQEVLTAITLMVNASDVDGTIKTIQFEVNGASLTSGNNVDWTPSDYGSYTIKVTVTDNNNATASAQIEVTIKKPTTGGDCGGIPTWNPGTIYPSEGGVKVSYNQNIYQNKWWTQNDEPGTSGPWGPWELIGSCSDSMVTSNNLVTVSPNPISNIITISLNKSATGELKAFLYHISGTLYTLIDYRILKSGNHKIDYDISKVRKGMYILKIEINNNVSYKKIFKK